jgi:hypothetical protein
MRLFHYTTLNALCDLYLLKIIAGLEENLWVFNQNL